MQDERVFTDVNSSRVYDKHYTWLICQKGKQLALKPFSSAVFCFHLNYLVKLWIVHLSVSFAINSLTCIRKKQNKQTSKVPEGKYYKGDCKMYIKLEKQTLKGTEFSLRWIRVISSNKKEKKLHQIFENRCVNVSRQRPSMSGATVYPPSGGK